MGRKNKDIEFVIAVYTNKEVNRSDLVIPIEEKKVPSQFFKVHVKFS